MIHQTPARERQPVPARMLVVEARYYDELADCLLESAKAAIAERQADCVVLSVPGALEIPTAVALAVAQAAALGKPFDAAVVLGCVIRGETSHYDIVAGESARALMDFSVRHTFPIGNAILTVENEAQAWARAREGQKGGEAAHAALDLVHIRRVLPLLIQGI